MRNTLYALTLFLAGTLSAQNAPNWAADVAPILYDHCVKCHRDGGLGHFSLIGYGNAVSNRFAIRDATQIRKMPPWKADPSYRHYTNENILTEAQIQTIADWVEADCPTGDLSAAPPDPFFSDGSEIGMPDQILFTPNYTVTALDDEYRCFVIPSGLNQMAFLRGLEALPSNHEAVHHILVYQDTTGQAKALDASTPEPGYVSFGGPGVNGAKLIGAWVPGTQLNLLPPNMGVRLFPNADLVVQVHYPAGSTGLSDQTTLNLFFTPSTQNIREATLSPLINHTPLSLENYPLNIPANTVKSYHAKFKVPIAGSVIAVAPHMHLIGRSITCFGVTPQGDTIPLVRIPSWDFHWQGAYVMQKLQKIPLNTMLHAYATYDNTTDNPFQPSFPPQNVVQGEATTDEMLLVYFTYVYYLPGDENIVLDSSLLSSALPQTPRSTAGISALSAYPNPATDWLTLEYALEQATELQGQIMDAGGRVAQIFMEKTTRGPGFYREKINVKDLPPGAYFLSLQAEGQLVKTIPFVRSGER